MSSNAARAAARRANEHGRNIFIYTNIRTNQTVYSLQRFMNNHNALGQLANAGKKTVPPKLRKDVWRPLATVEFPVPAHGLTAYRQLREFRKLHEMHWDNNKQYPMLPPERQKELEEGTTVPTKKERAKIIMDQKANSVADLAAVLRMQQERGQSVAKQHMQAIEKWAQAAEGVLDGATDELAKEIAANEAQLDNTTLTEDDKTALRAGSQKLLDKRTRLHGAEIGLHEALNAAFAVSVVLDSESADKTLNLRRKVIEYWLKVVEDVHIGVEELLERIASMEAKLQNTTLTEAAQTAIQGQVQKLNNHKNDLLSEWTAVKKGLGDWERKLEWTKAPGKVNVAQLKADIEGEQKRRGEFMAYWKGYINEVPTDIRVLSNRIASVERKLQRKEALLAEDIKTEFLEQLTRLRNYRDDALSQWEASETNLWKRRNVANGAGKVYVSEVEREIEDAQMMLQTGEFAKGRRALLEKHVDSLARHLEKVEGLVLQRFKAEMDAKLEHLQGSRKHKAITASQPIPSAAGVVVEWADIFDKEYAESWPEAVQHSTLGFTRHVAPDPAPGRTARAGAEKRAAKKARHAEPRAEGEVNGEATAAALAA